MREEKRKEIEERQQQLLDENQSQETLSNCQQDQEIENQIGSEMGGGGMNENDQQLVEDQLNDMILVRKINCFLSYHLFFCIESFFFFNCSK